jgi:hypothetical protein
MTSKELDINDDVFVVDWGKQYTGNIIKELFSTFIPQYSGTDFFWKIEYQELTQAGTPFKRRSQRPVKSRTKQWENFKYKIIEIVSYEDDFICLIVSKEGCHVTIGIEGLSYLTPQQYADEKFNALKESHRRKWDINMSREELKQFPEKLLETVYDKNDNVLFGSGMTKGKVQYQYIPGDYTKTGNPFIICVSVLYDGKGNSDLPEGSLIKDYNELPAMFPDNQFR